ncbi:MAG: hypothetical protein GY820_30005 [Gammaproteobacteria bacterium]|nr:hypothetical protein [Gammaproteobacteria bacterium]
MRTVVQYAGRKHAMQRTCNFVRASWRPVAEPLAEFSETHCEALRRRIAWRR